MLAKVEEQLNLPAGFTVRPCTMDDAAAVVELNNDCEEPFTGVRSSTVEDQKRGWTRPSFDLAHSTRVVVTTNGRIVGYASISDTNPVPVKVWVHVCVHPEFAGMGIGTALNDWAEARSSEAIERVDDDLQVVMLSGTIDKNQNGYTFLQNRAGMKEVRHFLRMTIDLDQEIPEPVLPEGVTIRPWSEVKDTVALADIARTDVEGFRDHYGFTEQPFDEVLKHWSHWIKSDKFDPTLWFLPMTAAGELVGVSLCENKAENVDNWGYLDSLAVLPAWRRKGIASALLHHTFRAFQARGYEKVHLHVDADSLTGATRVYERAGMYVSERWIDFEKVLRPGRDIRRQ